MYFLKKFWECRKNVVFSDEKGLGKKITVLGFLKHLYDQKNIKGPFLIVG